MFCCDFSPMLCLSRAFHSFLLLGVVRIYLVFKESSTRKVFERYHLFYFHSWVLSPSSPSLRTFLANAAPSPSSLSIVSSSTFSSPALTKLDPTRAPLGFHFVHLYYFIRTQRCFPNLNTLGPKLYFLNSVLTQILEVLGSSVDLVYALHRMGDSSDSSDFVMALNANLVREDSSELAQPMAPIRWGRFADMAYVAEHILSTLLRSRLKGLRITYQILETISLRVPSFDEWACSCVPNEVVVFKQALEAGLQFFIPLFVCQLLTYLRLAPRKLIPNGWRILIACMVMWPACSDGR